MRSSRILLCGLALLGVATAAALPQLSGCAVSDGKAFAHKVTSLDQLVGGPRALGEVGDFVLSNGRVRAVIQSASASRGFGVFGGSLIDLDLERARPVKNGVLVGGDGASEIFPSYFLRGLEPTSVTVLNDE